MSNYESYSCAKLLCYLESIYEHDTDRTNYAKLLLTMQEANSVKALMNIYDKVLWKFIQEYYGHYVSETWYDINNVSSEAKDYWRSLNAFLNENIKRIFDSQEYSDKLSLCCLTNLRESWNCISIWQDILSKSSDIIHAKSNEIQSLLSIIDNITEKITPYNINTNGYIESKKEYKESIKHLKRMGFIKSIKDTTFESRTNISFFPDTKTVIIIILFTLLAIPLFVLLLNYAVSGFILIICFLASIKLLRTYK